MNAVKDIIDCYNKTADNYAATYLHELEHKHLDRILLKSFAEENRDKGRMIDLGCGPGQTTRLLSEQGISDILGIDISESMIRTARAIHPQLQFEMADMLQLEYADKSFGSAIAFYSIVHFDETQLKKAFKEIRRVLKDGGAFLFSYHIGKQTVHLDEFLEQPVNIDFHFFEPSEITLLLRDAGFTIVDALEREAYTGEYPSKRAYTWVKAGSS